MHQREPKDAKHSADFHQSSRLLSIQKLGREMKGPPPKIRNWEIEEGKGGNGDRLGLFLFKIDLSGEEVKDAGRLSEKSFSDQLHWKQWQS
jgi:hypothetical protein